VGAAFSRDLSGAIAVKNRSHNPKTTDSKLQSFFFDLIGRFFWPAAGLTPET
jgi:hypothetical protein